MSLDKSIEKQSLRFHHFPCLACYQSLGNKRDEDKMKTQTSKSNKIKKKAKNHDDMIKYLKLEAPSTCMHYSSLFSIFFS